MFRIHIFTLHYSHKFDCQSVLAVLGYFPAMFSVYLCINQSAKIMTALRSGQTPVRPVFQSIYQGEFVSSSVIASTLFAIMQPLNGTWLWIWAYVETKKYRIRCSIQASQANIKGFVNGHIVALYKSKPKHFYVGPMTNIQSLISLKSFERPVRSC